MTDAFPVAGDSGLLERQLHTRPENKKKHHSQVGGHLLLTTWATRPGGTRGREYKARTAEWKGCCLFGTCFRDGKANLPTPVTLPVTLNSP